MSKPLNPYRMVNQLKKCLKIILTIQLGKLTAAQVESLDEPKWRIVLVAAGVKDASPETRELVIQGLKDAEEIAARQIPVAWVRSILGDVEIKGGDAERKKLTK